MATASEHGKIVLSAIIPGRRDLLERALHLLTPEHFQERVQSRMFAWLQRYSDFTAGAVLPRKYLDDTLRDRADPGQLQLFLESYDLYSESTVDDAEFAWSVQQLREIASEKATGEAITEAMEVLRNGVQDGREFYKGHEDARARLLERFQQIDRDLTMQDAPEGDVREERSDILSDYAERKNARERGTSQGILFGVDEIDRKVGGMQPGELVLVAGSSSSGKSSFAVQAAWSASVEQKKNVVFLTTETLRPQIRRKLVSRHSKLPMFDLPEGLNNRDLKAGTLDTTQEAKLMEVVDDLTNNPSYGHLYVAQVPRSASLPSLEQRLYRIQRRFQIDLVIVDYLALLTVDRRRESTREELSNLMKEAKLLAVTFDNARGVPLLSPWQMNRSGQEAAASTGVYTMRAMAETSEAANSADVILTMVPPEDNSERYADLTMQILKNRDGETASGMIVQADYATSAFMSRTVGMGVPRANSSGGSLFGGDDDELFRSF